MNENYSIAAKAFHSEKYTEALEIIDKCLGKEPFQAEYLNLKGLIHLKLKEFTKARSIFKVALDLTKNTSELQLSILINLASIFSYNENYHQAIKLMNSFEEFYLQEIDFNTTLLTLYIKIKNVKKTKEYLERSIKIAPNNLSVLSYAAKTYFELNEYSICIELCKNILNLEKDNKLALHYLTKAIKQIKSN